MAQLPGKVVQFVVESGLAAVVQKAGAQRDEREDVGDEQRALRVHAEGRQNEHGACKGQQKRRQTDDVVAHVGGRREGGDGRIRLACAVPAHTAYPTPRRVVRKSSGTPKAPSVLRRRFTFTVSVLSSMKASDSHRAHMISLRGTTTPGVAHERLQDAQLVARELGGASSEFHGAGAHVQRHAFVKDRHTGGGTRAAPQ